MEDIGKALRTVVPRMKLFVLAGDETPPAFDSIRPWTLIRKPMHLPEVLNTLARPSAPLSQTKPETTPLGPLPWLTDVDAAARHLTRLTLESSSQAALITRNHDVWAYAGELSRPAAEEVASVMARNWDSETDGDLLRFTRLETTRAEHILYATRIGRNTLLGLVFDAENSVRHHPLASRQARQPDRTRRRGRRCPGRVHVALEVELDTASPSIEKRSRGRGRSTGVLRSPTSSKTSPARIRSRYRPVPPTSQQAETPVLAFA